MTIDKLFSKLRNNIPLAPNSNKPFHQHLLDNFENYLSGLEQLNSNEFHKRFHKIEKEITLKKFITIEKKICDIIEESILEGRNGRINSAYKMLRSLLKNKTKNLSDNIYNYFECDFSEEIKEFYRIQNMEPEKYEFPNSMKHCPFENVYRTGNYRFSLSGFPCLYVGSSIDVCKLETSKPKDGERCYQAKFILKEIQQRGNKKQLFLNLVPPANCTDEKELFYFLLLYPFYITCLAKRKESEGNFHAEYIIPQLLLMYLREEKLLHGIKYLSTHSNGKDNCNEMINYVFPVRNIKDKGFDYELIGQFEMEEI